MIYGLYAIRDTKTGYLTPTVDHNDSSARRNFEHAVNQTESLFYSHPADYSLYKIGVYDTDTGRIEPIYPADLIVNATDCLAEGAGIFV